MGGETYVLHAALDPKLHRFLDPLAPHQKTSNFQHRPKSTKMAVATAPGGTWARFLSILGDFGGAFFDLFFVIF